MNNAANRFFQQLVARQQGHAETVQPLIASRFSSPASAKGVRPGLTSDPFSPEQSVFLPASPPAAESLSAPNSPLGKGLADSVTMMQQDSFFSSRGHNFLDGTPDRRPSQRSLPLPPVALTTEAPFPQDTAIRLASMTQWMAQSTTADTSQSVQQIRSSQTVPSTVNSSEASSDRSQNPPIYIPTQTPDNPLLEQALSSHAEHPTASVAAPAALAPLSQVKMFDSEGDSSFPSIRPNANNGAPTLPTSLQPVLQAAPLPAAPVASPPPTIQVAIGRIEIRATPPAATPPPPHRSRTVHKPTLSLDRYLQQRSRRS